MNDLFQNDVSVFAAHTIYLAENMLVTADKLTMAKV